MLALSTIFSGKINLHCPVFVYILNLILDKVFLAAGGAVSVEFSHMLMLGYNCDWLSEISNIPSKLSKAPTFISGFWQWQRWEKNYFSPTWYLMLLEPSLAWFFCISEVAHFTLPRTHMTHVLYFIEQHQETLIFLLNYKQLCCEYWIHIYTFTVAEIR